MVVHSTKASRYGQEYSYDWQRSHGILSYINTDGGVTSNARLLDDSSRWRETLGYNSSSGEFIDNSDSLREGVTKIFILDYAFAALKLDGSVVLWTYRPNSTGNRDLNFNPNSLKGKKIQDDVVDVIKGNFNGTPYIRFYALKSNGTVVTGSDYNRQTLRVADEYNGLLHNYEDSFLKRGPLSLVDDAVKIIPDYYNGGLINGHYYNEYPPIVIREGGILQTMGARYHLPPGNYHDVAINDWGFTAINNDGDVYAWERGRVEPVLADIGTVPANIVSSQYSNIRKVSVSKSAFAGLTKSGSVITWGSNSHGGDSTSVNHQLNEGVVDIVASADSFAAIKKDGSVVTWGGGSSDTSQVASSLVDGVISISSNSNAFAALKSDGSVVAWGSPIAGGNTSNVVTKIDGGVRRILGSDGYRSIGSGGFAALKWDGSVITWGAVNPPDRYIHHDSIKDWLDFNSSEIEQYLQGGVIDLVSLGDGFAALKSDGTVVSWGISSSIGTQGLYLPNPNNEVAYSSIEELIANDDLAPSSFSLYGPTEYLEGDSGISSHIYKVTRNGSTESFDSVAWKLSGDLDRLAPSSTRNGVLEFQPGDTDKNIELSFVGNTLGDPDGLILLELENALTASLMDGSATIPITIKDDDNSYGLILESDKNQKSLAEDDIRAFIYRNGPQNGEGRVTLMLEINQLESDGNKEAYSSLIEVFFSPNETEKYIQIPTGWTDPERGFTATVKIVDSQNGIYKNDIDQGIAIFNRKGQRDYNNNSYEEWGEYVEPWKLENIRQIYVNRAGAAYLAIDDQHNAFTFNLAQNGASSSIALNTLRVIPLYESFAAIGFDGSLTFLGGDLGNTRPLEAPAEDRFVDVIQINQYEQNNKVRMRTYALTAEGVLFDVKNRSVVNQKVAKVMSGNDTMVILGDDGSISVIGVHQFSNDVSWKLAPGVSNVVSNFAGNAFAALTTSGSVIAWGRPIQGGDISPFESLLAQDVIKISSLVYGFMALRKDGSLGYGVKK